MCGDPVRDAQGAAEERAVVVLGEQESGGQQRRGRAEAGAGGGVRRGQSAQRQSEADGGAAPGDVVVEVAVERLEPVVEVGEEGDEQDLHIEVGEVEIGGQAAQPGGWVGGVGAGLGLRVPRR
jgi:hypothetical protein